MPYDLNWWTIIIGGIASLGIYSYLIKENPFYRFFEHLFIGIATAITISLSINTNLWPKYFKPMLGFSTATFPDGTIYEEYPVWMFWYIIPILIGLLYYCILSRRYAWLAQIAIGISLGASGGLAFKGFFNQFMPQLTESFRPLTSISEIIFLIVLSSTFCYFFFTFKREEGGAISKFSSLGRWVMMGCFGAFFGTTIMARMSLLVERLQFFIDDWFPATQQLFA